MSRRAIVILVVAWMGVSVSEAQFDERCPTQGTPPAQQPLTTVTAESSIQGGGSVSIAGVADSGTSTAAARVAADAPGQCSVTADSSAADFAQAANACLDTNQPPSETECRNVNVQDDATCFATAASGASGFVSADCAPNGVACGSIAQDSVEVSCRVGRAIREVAERVNTFGDPICEESIVAVIDAVRSASSTLREAICATPDTTSTTSDTDFIAAVQDEIATAFNSCWMYCEGFGL